MVLESLLDVLHVGAAARQYDAAQQLVVVFVGNLVPRVLNDFLQASLDNLDELTALHLTVFVDGELERVVNVVVVSVGRGILQFHVLSLAFLHLQRGNIFRDIAAAEGNDGEVAQDVFRIDRDGCCVGTDVDECASRAFLGLGEHAVSQCERSQIELHDADAGVLEALVQFLEE